MKTIHTPEMVAHLWANKAQPRAQNLTHTLYFEGDTIYSYGVHFPIARHVRGAVLLTTRTYSSTTARHVAIVRQACNHLPTFNADLEATPRQQVGNYQAQYKALVGKYSKARNRSRILANLRELVSEANRYAEFCGLRARLTLPDDFAGMVAQCQAIERRDKIRKQRQARKQEREAQLRIQEWVDGKSDYCPSYGAIRLRIKGDELQTTRGARVPLAHAVKAYRTIRRLREKGQAYQRNGYTIHVGQFALDAIDPLGNVKAGCHEVAWEEIERVATLAGVN